jgi:hypothetical protein
LIEESYRCIKQAGGREKALGLDDDEDDVSLFCFMLK